VPGLSRLSCHLPDNTVACWRCLTRRLHAKSLVYFFTVHVRYMSSEVEPCVVWALRVLLPFLAKLIED
jgi:hypothetical protein